MVETCRPVLPLDLLMTGHGCRAGSRLHGDQIRVHAQSELDEDRATVWSTLSDYDHVADFIPEISSSRTVSRNGTEALVEQKGFATFGPIRQNFTVLFEVSEEPGHSISLTSVGGDFKRFEARYDVVPLSAHRSRIVYEATNVPAIALPPLLGLPVMAARRSRLRASIAT